MSRITSWLGRPATKPARKARLGLDRLEAREVPAVSATLSAAGLLSVTGDTAANVITVRQRAGQVSVPGVSIRNLATGAVTGGANNDRLNGRADQLLGGAGDDVLIAIDGGVGDYVDPWTGADVIWVDEGRSHADRLSGYGSGYTVQKVGGFSNRGADLTLDGDRIADPAVVSRDDDGDLTGHTYARFAGNPLFSSGVPRAADVSQGLVGDCWILSAAAAAARSAPAALRARVVDFDDGTYGVRLGDKFYRVDDDLPVLPDGVTPAYAGLGAGNAMWAAVLEKAYAHYRTGADSYPPLDSGYAGEAYTAITGVSTRNYDGGIPEPDLDRDETTT